MNRVDLKCMCLDTLCLSLNNYSLPFLMSQNKRAVLAGLPTAVLAGPGSIYMHVHV